MYLLIYEVKILIFAFCRIFIAKKMGAPYFRNCWGNDVLIAPFTNNARGVAILTKNVEVSFSDTIIDDNGNFIITKFKTQDETNFCLVNLYGPNSDDPTFYCNIAQKNKFVDG